MALNREGGNTRTHVCGQSTNINLRNKVWACSFFRKNIRTFKCLWDTVPIIMSQLAVLPHPASCIIHHERWHLGGVACRPWPWRSPCPSLFGAGDVNRQNWQMSQRCVPAIVGSSYCFPSRAFVNHLFELNLPALVSLSLEFHLCQLHGEREV